jgi:hypothetical protein
MKLNRIITMCAMTAALAWSVNAFAQDNGGNGGAGAPGGDQGGQRRMRGNGGGGGGGFDPAAMQQRRVDGAQEQLGFTNDVEWNAVKPLVQKVVQAQMDVMSGRFGGFGRNRGGGNQGNRPRFGQPNPEFDALQKAVEDNAPAAQVKDLLAKYRASVKAKQDKLVAAQADLKAVLTPAQEAQAVVARLLD